MKAVALRVATRPWTFDHESGEVEVPNAMVVDSVEVDGVEVRCAGFSIDAPQVPGFMAVVLKDADADWFDTLGPDDMLHGSTAAQCLLPVTSLVMV